MKIGAVFPTSEIGDDPSAIRDWAQAAEELGYDHVIAYDHVLGAVHEGREPALTGPYTERDPFHEPFVLFGFLAAATSRVELVTGVIILPQRQTALVAKQAAEIDVLSSGRLRLGVGTGWNYVEYESLGIPYEERASRFDEQIDVLRDLWTKPLVDVNGRYHRIDRAGILPRPQRSIPIWFGGGHRAAYRRAARVGDGFLFGRTGSRIYDVAEDLLNQVKGFGRDASAFGLETITEFTKGPERWREERDAWQAAGGTHYSMRAISTGASFLRIDAPGFTSPRQHIDALSTFMGALK